MTDTTSLRELPAKWRSEACDMRYTTNEPGPHDGARAEELEACADELEAALSARAEPQAGESADPFPWLREKVAEWEASEDILPAKHFAHELCSILDAMTGDDLRALIHARQQDNIAIVRADEGTSAPSPATPPAASDEAFADWLAKEMPPSTVISNPRWWASRILRAARRLAAVAPTAGDGDAKDAALWRWVSERAWFVDAAAYAFDLNGSRWEPKDYDSDDIRDAIKAAMAEDEAALPHQEPAR